MAPTPSWVRRVAFMALGVAAMLLSSGLPLLASASRSSSEASDSDEPAEKRGLEALDSPPAPPATYNANGCNADLLGMELPRGDGPEKGERTWARGHRDNKEWLRSVERTVNVAWYGDSIVQLMGQYQQAEYEAWNNAVEWREYITLGLTGDKTEQLLYRLNNGEWNGRMQPKAVVLSIGINNILRERIYERTSDRVVDRVVNGAAAGVRELIAFFHQQDCNIKIVLQAVLPTATGERNEWPGRFTRPVERLNARYRQLAEEYAHVTFNDCGDLFIQGGKLRQDLMPDLLHPGPDGYPVLAGCVAAGVKEALALRPPPPPPPVPPSPSPAPEDDPPAADTPDAGIEEQASMVLTNWGQCSAPCGGGQQRRGAQCFLRTIPVDMRLCSASTHGSVDLTRPCNIAPCEQKQPADVPGGDSDGNPALAIAKELRPSLFRSEAVPAAIDGDGRTMADALAGIAHTDSTSGAGKRHGAAAIAASAVALLTAVLLAFV